ncbi:MAG: PAS domain S-box protein, partial [Bacteroidota bacterium]|nr:PAS domain S-box protein [Bacteroidota bacterium]
MESNRYPSPAQLRQLFNSSLDILCSIDLSGRFVHMSEACRKILGYLPEEMIGQHVASFLDEADIEPAHALGDTIIRGTDKQNVENRYRHKDGSFVTLSWSCHWDAKVALMFCIGRNISERIEKEKLQAAYEKKIKQQNRQLYQMLGRITDAFYALDEDWRIVYANPQCERVLGLRAEDYLSLNLWEALPSLVDTALYEQYHYAVKENVTVHFEIYLQRFENWFEINAYPSETGLSVFFRVITDRIKAEEVRRRNEAELQMLSLIAKETTNAVCLAEPDSTISWINNAYTTIFGYTFEEAFGCKNSELLSGPLTDKDVLKELKGCFGRGEPFKGEMVAYTKGGELRWLEAVGQPLFDNEGKLERYFIIHTDITGRRLAEASLLQSNERFRLAAKTDAIYDWDLVTNHLFWGEGLQENFGFTPDELQMEQWEAALHPDDKVYLPDDLYRTLADAAATVWKYEYRLRRKDGSYCFVYERGHILRDAGGKAVRMVGIMQNITERKRIEAALEGQRKRTTAAVIAAQEKERSFVSQELHDSVNPVLTTVKLYQDLILSDEESRATLVNKSKALLQDSINEIRRLSKRLSIPVRGIHSFADSVKELLLS